MTADRSNADEGADSNGETRKQNPGETTTQPPEASGRRSMKPFNPNLFYREIRTLMETNEAVTGFRAHASGDL